MDDKSPQHKAVHEISYFDEFTKQNERIAPGTALDESHVKSLGREQFERLVEKGAIKKVEQKAAKVAGPSLDHTKVVDKPGASKGVGVGDGFNS